MILTKEDEPLLIVFDPLRDAEWPDGAFACGIPGSDTYYGATADEAYAKWRAAPSPVPTP